MLSSIFLDLQENLGVNLQKIGSTLKILEPTISMMPFEDLLSKINKESGIEIKKVESLILEKQEELSGLVSKEGAAYIVGRELGVNLIKEGRQEFKIKNIISELRSIDLTAKILKIFESRSFEKNGKRGAVQNILLGDETGKVMLVLWGEDVQKASGLGESDVIRISQAYSKKSNSIYRDVEISLNKRGAIEKVEKKIDVLENSGPAVFEQKSRLEIKDLQENMYGNFRGCFVHIFRRSPVYFVCPMCNSSLDKLNNCKSHGVVQNPQKNLMFAGVADDGTGSIRIVLFRDLAEKVYQIKAEEIDLTDLNKFYDGLDSLGKEFIIGGRVKKNNFSSELELVANKLEPVDPKQECKELLKEINLN